MSKNRNRMDSVSPKSIIGISGILSVLIISINGAISYILYPYYEYDFFLKVISALGVRESGIFFNAGLIFSGIFLIVFLINLNTVLTKNLSKRWQQISKALALISSVSYSLLGFFPVIFIVHVILAFNFFFFGMLDYLILSYLIINNRKISNTLSIGGIILIVSILMYFTFLLIMYNIHSIFEWIMFIVHGIWVLMVSFYFISKKKI